MKVWEQWSNRSTVGGLEYETGRPVLNSLKFCQADTEGVNFPRMEIIKYTVPCPVKRELQWSVRDSAVDVTRVRLLD